MQKIKNNVLVRLVLPALVFYAAHWLVLRFFFAGISGKFIYPVGQLYLFFGISSLLICSVLLYIRRKELNNVGYSFLLLTVVKMAIASFFIQPILKTHAPHQAIEKYNFFVIFLVFLAIETVTTIRILNKK